MENYQDQIKSPLWQKKRLEILNLKGFKCEECSCETKQLHVHHRFYLKNRKIYEYDNDVFQVLCEDCHKKVHEKKEVLSLNSEFGKFSMDIKTLISLINKMNKNDYDNFSFVIQNIDNSFWEKLSFIFNRLDLINKITNLYDLENGKKIY